MVMLVLSLILTFPVASAGEETDDAGFDAATTPAASEGAQDPEGSSLPENVHPSPEDGQSGDGSDIAAEDAAASDPDLQETPEDPDAQELTEEEYLQLIDDADLQQMETVYLQQLHEEEVQQAADEEAEEEEVIVVEYERKALSAKHTYKIKQPKNAKSPVTKWQTSKKSVATVSSKGVITAHKIGVAVVRGFDKDGHLRKSIIVTVTLGSDYTLFVAHKGYSAVAPENTLPAFRAAVKAGFNGIEFDIWESTATPKSAKPCIMVIHDKNLKDKTGKRMKAYKLTKKNRSKYKIRKNVNGIKKYGPQTIPTLEEALNCIYKEAKAAKKSDFVVEIDVKGSLSDRAIKHIVKSVGRHRVHIIATETSILKKFKKYRKYKSTELWYCTNSRFKSKRVSAIKTAGKEHFDGVSIPYRNMSNELIRLARSKKVKIGGYGVRTAESVQKWALAGCTRFNMNNKVFH